MYQSRHSIEILAGNIAMALRLKPEPEYPSVVIETALREHEMMPFDNSSEKDENWGRGETPYEELMTNVPTAWAMDRLKTLATTGDHYNQILACAAIIKLSLEMAEDLGEDPWTKA